MDEVSKGVIFGIDINEKNTMISYYLPSMDEPETISTVVGSESYQIPTYLSKRKGIGQWFFGREAKKAVALNQAVGVENLYKKALHNEEIIVDTIGYNARELLVIFMKRILGLSGHFYAGYPLKKLVISVTHLDMEVIELFTLVANRLNIRTDNLFLLDHQESFYYFALSQKPQLFVHDVMLFDYTGQTLTHCLLQRNSKTTPQMITLLSGSHGALMDDKDLEFDDIVRETFTGKIISSVYLVGDGFDGSWMKKSLQSVCRNRKAFLGKNLYSKGACYAGIVKEKEREWPFIHIGDNELKIDLSLKIYVENKMQFYTLIPAGESWYETKGECEVILDGTPEIECWVQKIGSRKTRIEVLEIKDLPEREKRTTRLRITAKPLSDKKVEVMIRDLGFGEIVPGTNRTWRHVVGLEDLAWEN